MKVLVVDTETTGLPMKGDQYGDHQPYVIQVAGILFDMNHDGIEHTLNTLVVPPQGIIFHEKAVQTHGFSEEVVRANGKNAVDVYTELRDMRKRADAICAYNWDFDERLIRTSSERQCPDFKNDPVCGIDGEDIIHHCIMEQAMHFFKHPRQKLSVVYRQLMGVPLIDAHDALADAVAAMHVMKQMSHALLSDD